MSQVKAKFVAIDTISRVEDHEIIKYELLFLEGIFNTKNREIVDNPHKFGRCLKEKLEGILAQHRCLCGDYPDTGLGLPVHMNQEKGSAEELLVGSI